VRIKLVNLPKPVPATCCDGGGELTAFTTQESAMSTFAFASRTEVRPRVSELRLVVIAAFIALLEGYDLSCYGSTVPSLLNDHSMHATKGSAGTVGSLVAVGMAIGAAVVGALANRFSARKLVPTGVIVFSAGMVICTAAGSFSVFGAGRLVVGIGLGAVLPVLISYLAEVSAPERRNRNVGYMMAGFALGALAAPLLTAALLPETSWRWIYFTGVVLAVAALPAAVFLTASPVTHRREPFSRELLGLRPLLSRPVIVATLLFWVVSFCALLLTYAVSTWLPTIMQTNGYSLGSSLVQTAVMWAGAGLGMIAGGRVGDKVGIKPVVVVAFLVGAVSMLIISVKPPIGLLFVLMFVSGLGFVGSQALTNALIVTRYPEALRRPGIGWALAIGRIGAIVGPTLGGVILSSHLDVRWSFYFLAIPGAIAAVLTACVPRIGSRSA
jgi:AAHS family benzoate transporter-like MFS transporter